MTSQKDADNLSGAYALNALDNDERTEFEAQLGESEETRNEVTELSDTAVLLGLAVEPVEPSAELKTSIMAKLASTPQLPREVAPVRTLTPAPQIEDDAPAAATARIRWFTRPVAALTAVAAAIAIIVGGGVIANSLIDNGSQVAEANQLAAINAADDFQQTVVDVDGGGSAKLVWSLELASSALIVDGLKQLPSDRTYELWYIDAAGARPAGVFSVGSDGGTWQVLDGKMAKGDTVGVTVEPRGGSESPTTDPIITVASA
ncbi:MAG: anti-sigma factor [Rhodoglobus sp.]